MTIKANKKIKGVVLEDTVISIIEKEAAKQRRSFSAQAGLILTDWAKGRLKRVVDTPNANTKS